MCSLENLQPVITQVDTFLADVGRRSGNEPLDFLRRFPTKRALQHVPPGVFPRHGCSLSRVLVLWVKRSRSYGTAPRTPWPDWHRPLALPRRPHCTAPAVWLCLVWSPSWLTFCISRTSQRVHTIEQRHCSTTRWVVQWPGVPTDASGFVPLSMAALGVSETHTLRAIGPSRGLQDADRHTRAERETVESALGRLTFTAPLRCDAGTGPRVPRQTGSPASAVRPRYRCGD